MHYVKSFSYYSPPWSATATQQGGCYYHSHFSDGELKFRKIEITYPRPQSYRVRDTNGSQAIQQRAGFSGWMGPGQRTLFPGLLLLTSPYWNQYRRHHPVKTLNWCTHFMPYLPRWTINAFDSWGCVVYFSASWHCLRQMRCSENMWLTEAW